MHARGVCFQIIIAAKMSATECCLTKATETQMRPRHSAIPTRTHMGTAFSRSQMEAIPIVQEEIGQRADDQQITAHIGNDDPFA